MQKQRRNFIKSAALGSLGLGAIASSLLAQNGTDKSAQDVNASAKKQEPKKPHYGMIFDQNKCVGCTDCEIACKKVNLVPKGQMPSVVSHQIKEEHNHLSHPSLDHLPRMFVHPPATSDMVPAGSVT